MTDIQMLILGRVLERLSITLFGGISIVLGWHLFRVGIDKHQNAELRHGSWSLRLERVGPGVFFALFGAALLTTGLANPLSTTPRETAEPGAAQPQDGQPALQLRYLTDRPGAALAVAQSINTMVRHVERLEDEREKQRLEPALSVLESLRDDLVLARFGRAEVEAFRANEAVYMRDPTALNREDRELADELSRWLVESLAPGRSR